MNSLGNRLINNVKYVVLGCTSLAIAAVAFSAIRADMYDGDFERGRYKGFRVSAGFNSRNGTKVAKIFARSGPPGYRNVPFVAAADMNHDEVFQRDELVYSSSDEPYAPLKRFANAEEMENIFEAVSPSRPRVERN
jgi:hypothetical protein